VDTSSDRSSICLFPTLANSGYLEFGKREQYRHHRLAEWCGRVEAVLDASEFSPRLMYLSNRVERIGGAPTEAIKFRDDDTTALSLTNSPQRFAKPRSR